MAEKLEFVATFAVALAIVFAPIGLAFIGCGLGFN